MASSEKLRNDFGAVLVEKKSSALVNRAAKVALVIAVSYCASSYWTNSTVRSNVGPLSHGLWGKAAEAVFLSVPNEARAIEASRLFAAKPHLAGSSQDLVTAKAFLRLLQTELGIAIPHEEPIYKAGSPESQKATLSISESYTEPRAWIDTYYPIVNSPLERRVQILDTHGNVDLELDLVERPDDDTDPDAFEFADAVPAFHGLSRAGDVSGPTIDGGYCTKKEFDEYVDNGVDFKGTIVLCRYGWSFRGLKVKAAQELGALGVLVFNDVKDDGTVTEANGYRPYPHGPARNPHSIQRGGVQFVSMYPGDPTTPGYPSYENATRTKGENIPSIPSMPLSWANGALLLRTLDPTDELFGRRARLLNNVENKVTPIWNTMGVIPGHIKSEVVVIGNHRDAWVLGATDPISGTATLHEVIRGLGYLLKKGWKPLRTIVIASWDAEEWGLIGSTEWGEDFTGWIDKHVVAYLNLDGAASGSRLRYGASPLLSHLIRQAAEDLPHPTDKSRTLWDATKDDGVLFGMNASLSEQTVLEARDVELKAVDDVGVSPLGSGSDYTVFLQRIGVPSTNGGFGSTYHDPVYHYHSVFDTERWQEMYGDPGFHRHIAVAKHLGLQTLRISESVILPFNTTHYTLELGKYLDRVEKLALDAGMGVSLDEVRASIRALYNASLALDDEKEEAERNLRHVIREGIKRSCGLKGRMWGVLRTVLCPLCKGSGRSPFGWSCPPKGQGADSFGELDDAYMDALRTEHSRRCGSYREEVQAEGMSMKNSPQVERIERALQRVQAVNKKLITFERGFISKDGIKDRQWFKHLGVAPGKWLGYGATIFPGLSEAITFEHDTSLVQHEAGRLKDLLDRLSDTISV